MLSELAFSADDLALTRFAISPMWEVVTSFRLLAAGSAHPVHRAWTDQVRPRVAAAGLDSGWLAELIPPTGYLPDFLTPPPTTGPGPRHGTGRHPRHPGRSHPGRSGHPRPWRPSLPGTARRSARAGWSSSSQEIESYWELALAPYWAKIRAVLDADVFHRARQVAERGAGPPFQ